ncbi:hypothetical protein M1397_01735 [Candidatus Marsarchaeota archaeon]|nr:hypothetical protein [Candidatus Marsarchaeota archaeon]
MPITLSNSQSSATPAPFQQLITFNPSSYSSYEASNLGNIRFYTGVGGCTISSSSANFWVYLPNGINANSSTIVYMTF